MNLWFDQQRNLLVYEGRGALPELQGCQQINGAYLAVPRNLQNCQILRRYGYPIPPIIDNYDWPHAPGITPYASQIIAANFLVSHPHCFNLSDMGVGKTLAALWAADWLMQQATEPCRGLIVCPLSIMERVWGQAIFRNFLDRRSVRILHGTEDRRLDQLQQAADFYIVNFDGVGVGARRGQKGLEIAGFCRALQDRSDVHIVIVDEATAYRDSRTRRSKLARLVFGSKPYLWCLTGTPTPNSPVDAYGLAKLVNNALGRSFTGFRADTMYKPFSASFKWLPKAEGYDKARALLQPAIRFDIKDVWDGPEMTTQQRQVALTLTQIRLLKDIKRQAVVEMQSGQRITAVNEAAIRTKYLQIALGAIYDNDHDVHETDAKPRVDELKAVIEEAPGKLLIFASLTSVVNLLYRLLPEWSREVVNGDVSAKERSRIFAAFEADVEPRLLIADPGTMAHGLDLWRAQTVCWYGSTDKNELYLQANKRAHRPGQKYPVTVVQLVATALEREIYQRLDASTTLQGALLDVIKKGEL